MKEISNVNIQNKQAIAKFSDGSLLIMASNVSKIIGYTSNTITLIQNNNQKVVYTLNDNGSFTPKIIG